LYDELGDRVFKAVQTQGNVSTLTFRVAGVFERTLRLQSEEPSLCEDLIQISDGSWGIARLLKTSKETRALRVLPDHLGSVVAVVDLSGIVLDRIQYMPYGELAFREINGRNHPPLNNDLHGFLGKKQDAETGLIDLRARCFAPWLGRFMTPESLADTRRLSTRVLDRLSKPTDPPNFGHPRWASSRYTYAVSSPLTNIEVDGRDPMKAIVEVLATGAVISKVVESMTKDVIISGLTGPFGQMPALTVLGGGAGVSSAAAAIGGVFVAAGLGVGAGMWLSDKVPVLQNIGPVLYDKLHPEPPIAPATPESVRGENPPPPRDLPPPPPLQSPNAPTCISGI